MAGDPKAQAVLDTKALEVAKDAEGKAGTALALFEQHQRWCQENERQATESRRLLHGKMDALSREVDDKIGDLKEDQDSKHAELRRRWNQAGLLLIAGLLTGWGFLAWELLQRMTSTAAMP